VGRGQATIDMIRPRHLMRPPTRPGVPPIRSSPATAFAGAVRWPIQRQVVTATSWSRW